MPVHWLGIKYVASGEEIYYANDKKYKVNAKSILTQNITLTDSVLIL